MRTNWYIARDKKKQGPFTIAQMQEKARIGQLLPIDMVLSEGAQQWQPAAQVDDFFPRLQTAPPPPIPVAEAKEWHLSQGGKQSGPVTMTDLKGLVGAGTLRPDDLVWKAGLPAWIAASTVQELFPPPSVSPTPPPLPPTVPGMALVGAAKKVTGEVVLEGFGGAVMPGQMNKLEVKLSGKPLGSGSLVAGVRLPFEATVGNHTIEIAMSGGIAKLLGGFGKKIEASASGRTYPITFDLPGHYLVTLTPSRIRGQSPSGVEVTLVQDAAQHLALAPVVEEEPEEGLVQRGFAAIGRGVKNMQESSRRSQLIGLWEPVNFSSQWFMFTKDNAMLRGDGFATKFRWLDDTKVELYADETDKTVQFTVLSLGEFELILKTGDQSGHFRKGTTITEELRQMREEENRKRRAEAAANFKNVAFGVASVLAAGGFAVLCCGVAVGAASAGGRCRCQWPIRHGNYCVNCGYML